MITRLSVEGLSLARGDRMLFQGLSLELAAGEALALTGANGAGKTSLLRAVAGLIRPMAGVVRFWRGGAEIEAEAARAGGMHWLGHQDGLKPGRTAAEELGFWSRWLGGGDIGRAVAALDLAPLLALEVRKLSSGQRRRLALAQLLAAPRPLWLLDEPLAPLDARRRAGLGELMLAHLDGGGMILAAVHDPLPVATRVLAVGSA